MFGKAQKEDTLGVPQTFVCLITAIRKKSSPERHDSITYRFGVYIRQSLYSLQFAFHERYWFQKDHDPFKMMQSEASLAPSVDLLFSAISNAMWPDH